MFESTDWSPYPLPNVTQFCYEEYNPRYIPITPTAHTSTQITDHLVRALTTDCTMDYTYHGSNLLPQITVGDLKIPVGISAYKGRSAYCDCNKGYVCNMWIKIQTNKKHLVGFITKKFVMMQGHMNVIFKGKMVIFQN